jgi:hypothetical protein
MTVSPTSARVTHSNDRVVTRVTHSNSVSPTQMTVSPTSARVTHSSSQVTTVSPTSDPLVAWRGGGGGAHPHRVYPARATTKMCSVIYFT